MATSPLSAFPLTPVDLFLADQQNLTAVERFSDAHDRCAVGHRSAASPGAGAHRYRDLIPLARPDAGQGQQYAFEVDLDLCTGCKACVTGCHNLNGLDEGEVWRTVGLLHGGSPAAPVQQTVTTACHHCVEPACMTGCPVKAYEKDPLTGIVKHLDDQCIGCQYCVFMCPYDAPKFNKARGIVRKCDMCSDRLAHDEAPACVQSCPNEAIRIAIVQRSEVIEAAESNAFLPGAPGPGDTLPSTVYRTERALPHNMLPANFYSLDREHAHLPLVVMLTLTQLAVGAFGLSLALGWMLARGTATGATDQRLGLSNALFALVLAFGALAASSLHLGRPQYAFRAVLGLRTSGLSREILTFSMFAFAGVLHAGSVWLGRPDLGGALGIAAAVCGVAGVFSSVMVYAATRRAHWRGSLTGAKFALTSATLGIATVLMVSTLAARVAAGSHRAFAGGVAFRGLCAALLIVAAVKLLFELSILRHLRDRRHSTLKRSAILMVRDLVGVTATRFITGALGGLALPGAALAVARYAPPHAPAILAVAVVPIFLCCLAGELAERYLFFAAAPPSKMPGGLA
jgi:formate dehydrogenase iron-sulfur subunit